MTRKPDLSRLALGAGLGLAGVALVEGLLLLGLQPLTPIGWPALGTFAGAALGGVWGFAGGTLAIAVYYVINLLQPHRFPDFYGSAFNMVSWLVGLGAVGLAILAARPRVLRAAASEAELTALRAYEEALRDSEARLRMVTDNIPALVSYIDAQQRYRFNNRAYEQWVRMPRDEIAGRKVREIWGEEMYARFKPNIERALRGERVSYEYSVTDAGVERHVLASYVPDFDGAGRVKGFFVLGSDVTQLVTTRRELAAQRARLEAALDGSSVALWETDLQNGRVYLSDAWAQMLGAPAGETVATMDELLALLHPDDVEAVRRASLEALRGPRGVYAVEHRVRARNGEWMWVLSRGRVTERDPQSGRALRMIGTNYDITDRRRVEEAVQSAAQSDPLTGLANRLLFTDRLRLALARSARTGSRLAVLYLDVDRFKEINDRLGHAAGDALLKDFAARLRASVRATDTVARFGGDEFVVLLDDVKEAGHAVRVAEKIVAECREPLRIEGHDVVATASIGLAYGAEGAEVETLLRRADTALYEAKSAGRNGYRVAP
ncbi:MAG TPA: diguanylate cyclase [Burkholderiales bacterium]|nr:diguanylate cyclase [Burkholderiales bacterium]